MDYTAIADAGEALVSLLREGLVPDVVRYGEQIGLCAPQEKGEYAVKVWLYDIRRSGLMQSHEMVELGNCRQRYPSAYVELFYMITACSGGEVRYQAKHEAHILGRIIQTLCDTPVIAWGEEELPGSGHTSHIELLNPPMDEKLKIYHVPDGSYKTSLFYGVGPVEISSRRERGVIRVKDVRYHLQERE